MLRKEYPRPHFKRNSFISLNGEWDFAYLNERKELFDDTKFNKKIIVPFCFESSLSGINDTSRHDLIAYKKVIDLKLIKNKKYLLNFDGVDFETLVFINNQFVGQHTGSAARFSFDISSYLNEGKNEIRVLVYDPSFKEDIPRGKQTWEDESKSIWYTRTSGIYKSVWIEEVPLKYIKRTSIFTDIDNGEVIFNVEVNEIGQPLTIKVFEDNKLIKEIKTTLLNVNDTVKMRIWDGIFDSAFHNENHLWSPSNPHLYDVIFEYGDIDKDEVTSYFGMRKVEIKNNIIYLNNRPLYQKLVLIQGYYKDGIMTPKDISTLENDVLISKKLGFNGARIHQKVEDDYMYYYADKHGFLIWCESPSCAKYSKESEIIQFNEWTEIINQQSIHPSIICYTPLNESWGINEVATNLNQQLFAKSLYNYVKSLDPSRIVISNDGWEHLETDIVTFHDYTTDFNAKSFNRFKKSLESKKYLLKNTFTNHKIFVKNFDYQINKPFLLSEYGGMALISDQNKNDWGYCVSQNENEYLKTYEYLQKTINESPYLAGYCFTQLYDVEQEKNGILTYERMLKVDIAKIKRLNDLVEASIENEE